MKITEKLTTYKDKIPDLGREYNFGKKWGWIIVRTIFLAGFCFTILYPVLLAISKSFMTLADSYDNTVLLIPRNFTLDNYIGVSYVIDYWNTLQNSLVLSIAVTVLQTFSCLLVGYGFARFEFKFKGLLFSMVIFTIIVPPQVLTIPMFLHFRFFDIFGIINAVTGKGGVNLLDTYLPYFMLGLLGQGIRNGLFIFIFRQFFKGMPKETEESALVDGAGYFRIFYRIMLPNAITSAITVALFSFVWQYNDLSYAATFLPNTKVISMAYENLEQARGLLYDVGFTELFNPQQFGLLRSAAVILILLPVILIYAVAQKFFVNSVERSGIVG